MRCKNCGWENEAGRMTCEKCSAPLSETSGNCESPSISNLKGTIPEGRVFDHSPQTHGEDAGQTPSNCPSCNYPLGRGISVCPMCGSSAVAGRQNAPAAASPALGTVNPWASPQNNANCTLRPLAWDNENSEHAARSYSGQSVMLNRDNTDPGNPTITSQVQAEMVFEDGAWYICDKSAQQTTYVHAGRKTRLEKGDIIILGNRRFEFNG